MASQSTITAAETVQIRPHFIDERDAFIAWLKGEFAASNALIDVLLQHLTAIGDPGEYDHVATCVQSRRANWAPVLHLQQFYPINEVVLALQQVAWARREGDRGSFRGFEGRRGGFGRFRNGRREGSWVNYRYGVAQGLSDEGNGENYNYGGSGEEEGDFDSAAVTDGSAPEDGDETGDQNRKQDVTNVPRDVFAKETFDGKMVTVAEGLELYEELLDRSEVSELVALAEEMRAAGHRGELPGQTAVTMKRPMRGHGREMIQFGIRVTGEDDGNQPSSECKLEAIPSFLEEFFDKLVKLQILPNKPDYCIIDFFNEGDHSTPHMWPSWYGRQICNFFLTDCEIVYGNGRDVVYDYRGAHSGPFKLSITPGALLLMEGKRADLPKRAIPSIRKRRIILTFGKYHPRKALFLEASSSATFPVPPQQLGITPIKSSNHQRRPPGPKSYGGAIPSAGVLPVPPAHPQNVPNGMQPLFVASASVAPAAVPYSMSPAAAVWTVTVPPRHPAPRVQAPGTGVFLPPGSSNRSSSQQSQAAPLSAEPNGLRVLVAFADSGSSTMEKPSSSCSPKNIIENAGVEMECNVNWNGDAGGRNENQQSTVSKKLVDKQTDANAK